MPNLDGSGPRGLGPMTGRKLGRCTNKADIERQVARVESAEGEVYGLGRGGRPFGGGRGNCFAGGFGRRAMGRERRYGR